ncbi:unnamed protein product, partial [Musa hybrid cultivar]
MIRIPYLPSINPQGCSPASVATHHCSILVVRPLFFFAARSRSWPPSPPRRGRTWPATELPPSCSPSPSASWLPSSHGRLPASLVSSSASSTYESSVSASIKQGAFVCQSRKPWYSQLPEPSSQRTSSWGYKERERERERERE